MIKKLVFAAAISLAVVPQAGAWNDLLNSVWGSKGNDTGGIIPWTPENERGNRALMAVDDTETEGARELDELFERFGIDDDWALGFLAAVLTGPEVVPPSTWLPLFLGEEEFANEPEARAGFDAIMRLCNGVAGQLRCAPAEVCPEGDDDEGIETFCKGYIRGASLHPSWEKNERGLALLCLFTALAGEVRESDLQGPDDQPLPDSEAWLQEHRNQLGAYLAELHDLFASARLPVITKPKAGRNEPCPCGSGKKYKKCCLF